MTCTTAPQPDNASRSTAFNRACDVVSNNSSGVYNIHIAIHTHTHIHGFSVGFCVNDPFSLVARNYAGSPKTSLRKTLIIALSFLCVGIVKITKEHAMIESELEM